MTPTLRTDRAGRTAWERIEDAMQRVPGWDDPRQLALPMDKLQLEEERNLARAPVEQRVAAVCDCCKRRVPCVRSSAWHGTDRICLACFYVWYDPNEDIDVADPAQVAAAVLQAEAVDAYPFGRDDAEYRRVT